MPNIFTSKKALENAYNKDIVDNKNYYEAIFGGITIYKDRKTQMELVDKVKTLLANTENAQDAEVIKFTASLISKGTPGKGFKISNKDYEFFKKNPNLINEIAKQDMAKDMNKILASDNFKTFHDCPPSQKMSLLSSISNTLKSKTGEERSDRAYNIASQVDFKSLTKHFGQKKGSEYAKNIVNNLDRYKAIDSGIKNPNSSDKSYHQARHALNATLANNGMKDPEVIKNITEYSLKSDNKGKNCKFSQNKYKQCAEAYQYFKDNPKLKDTISDSLMDKKTEKRGKAYYNEELVVKIGKLAKESGITEPEQIKAVIKASINVKTFGSELVVNEKKFMNAAKDAKQQQELDKAKQSIRAAEKDEKTTKENNLKQGRTEEQVKAAQGNQTQAPRQAAAQVIGWRMSQSNVQVESKETDTTKPKQLPTPGKQQPQNIEIQ